MAVKNKKCKQSSKQFKYERRLAKQRVDADQVRNGKLGAASPARRIDPVTGETIGLAERVQIKHRRLSRKPALRVIAQAGRSGACAASLAENESAGMAVGVALVARGDAAVTRNNRFILKRLEKKTIAASINWDEGRSQDPRRGQKTAFGMIEPPPLPPRPKIKPYLEKGLAEISATRGAANE